MLAGWRSSLYVSELIIQPVDPGSGRLPLNPAVLHEHVNASVYVLLLCSTEAAGKSVFPCIKHFNLCFYSTFSIFFLCRKHQINCIFSRWSEMTCLFKNPLQ